MMAEKPQEPTRTPGKAEGGREVVNAALQNEPGRTPGSAEGERDTVSASTPQTNKTTFTRAEAESLHQQGAAAVLSVLQSLSQEIMQLRSELKALQQRLIDGRQS